MKNILTFVMPTIGRDSIGYAVDSVKAQTSGEWLLAICGDGFLPENNFGDPRIFCVEAPPLGSAGEVRNFAVKNYVGTEWVAFIDDDDYIYPEYVSLWEEAKDSCLPDVVLFKMNNYGVVVPRQEGDFWLPEEAIEYGNIGMSFAAKTELIFKYPFDNEKINFGSGEDYRMIKQLNDIGARIWFDNYIGYHVRKHQDV